MKDIAIQTAREAKGREIPVLREYLQNYILYLMLKRGLLPKLCFVGGSALRFLYKIRRFSQDLDFSSAEEWQRSDLSQGMERIQDDLLKAGYEPTIRIKQEKNLQRAIVRVAGLLYELGLSQRREQKISVHVEIDMSPSRGWKDEKTIVEIYMAVLLRHYDLPSLFASKIAAVFLRPYTKGRDLFDLQWFRAKWKELVPNLELLNNTMARQKNGVAKLDAQNWRMQVHHRIEELDWKEVLDDVRPFLESEDDLLTFTKENLLLLY